jgi:hypothetical protein
MDWSKLDFRISEKTTVSDADREVIRKVAEEAILNSDGDPEIVLNVAAKALSRVSFVNDFRKYAGFAVHRALRKDAVSQAKKEARALAGLEPILSFADNERIENAILVKEILDKLSPQDREIFARRLEGETFPEIDVSMRLRSRTAEWRFRICSAEIRNSLRAKSGSGKT